MLRQQNQKLVADYEALAKEHTQLKTRYSDLDKTFGELNIEWVKLKNEEWLLQERVAQFEVQVIPCPPAPPIPKSLIDFLGYLVAELKSCPPNRVAPLRKTIDERLVEFLKTIDPEAQLPQDKQKNGTTPYHFDAIEKAIAKLKK